MAVSAIAWLAVEIFSFPEPSYHGRTLTQWIYRNPQYHIGRISASYSFDAETEAAIKAIGTNGLPVIIKLLGTSDGTIKSKLAAVVNGQSLVHIRIYPDIEKRMLGKAALELLGTNALAATPALVALSKAPDPGVRYIVIDCLSELEPGSNVMLPLLTEHLHDSAAYVREWAAVLLIFSYPDQAQASGAYAIFPELAPVESTNVTNQLPPKN